MGKKAMTPEEAYNAVIANRKQTERVMSPEEAYNAVIANREHTERVMSPEEAYAYIMNRRQTEGYPSQTMLREGLSGLNAVSAPRSVFDIAPEYDPNLPDWSMRKGFSGGISDIFGRIASVIGMNTEQIKSVADKRELAEIPADPYLTQTEKAAILQAKSGGQPNMLGSLLAGREKAQESATSAKEYFDPGAYNMPQSVGGRLVHDVTRAMPYTLVSMAYNIPIGLATGGGSLIASLLAASPEAQMEQADVYETAIKEGKSHEEAYALSQKVLAGNMAVLPLSNYMQSMLTTGITGALDAANAGKPLDTLLGRSIGKAAKTEKGSRFLNSRNTRDIASILFDTAAEGGEEAAQGYMSDNALGKQVDPGALAYEALVGGLMGSMFGAAGVASDRAFNGRRNSDGRIDAKVKKPSGVDAFMEGIAEDISRGDEGTIPAEEGNYPSARKYVPNTAILNEIRGFYSEIRDIPEAQRSAEDTEKFGQLRTILETYSSGREEEAETLAKKLFQTDALDGAEGSSPPAMPMKESYPESVQIVPRAEGGEISEAPSGNAGPEIMKRAVGLALGDFRRLNAMDSHTMSEQDKYKFEMLNHAVEAFNKGDSGTAARIVGTLYGAAAMAHEEQSAPIEGRQFVNSELAVIPGARMQGPFTGQPTPQATPQDKEPRYVEVPYPVRRKAEVVADVAKMSKRAIREKYGEEVARAGSAGAMADVVLAQEEAEGNAAYKAAAKTERTDESRQKLKNAFESGRIVNNAAVEKLAEQAAHGTAPQAALDITNRLPTASERPGNTIMNAVNPESALAAAQDTTKAQGEGMSLEEVETLIDNVETSIRNKEREAKANGIVPIADAREGATLNQLKRLRDEILKTAQKPTESKTGAATSVQPGNTNPAESGAQTTKKPEGTATLDSIKIIRQDNNTKKQNEGGRSDDDRGNDATDDKPLGDELSEGVRGAGEGLGAETGDSVREADKGGDGHSEAGGSADDGLRSLDGIAEPVLHDVAAGAGNRGAGSEQRGNSAQTEDIHGRDGDVPGRARKEGQRDDEGSRIGEDSGRPSVGRLNPKEGGKPSKLSGENPGNFFIGADFKLGEGTDGEKIKANVNALRVLMKLRTEKRYPTSEEQAAMARYVGWGGLKPVFDVKHAESNNMFGKAQRELKEMLSDEEYQAAFRTVNDAHYTSRGIVNAMWKMARHFGFKGGRALEPTIGVGNFLGLEPADLASATEWYASEIDTVTGEIAAALYPEANVLASTGFQDAPFADGAFDLVIGNPPFGAITIKDKSKKRKHLSGMKIHNYVIAKSGMHLRPGGVMAFVVTHRFLDTANPEARDVLAKDFRFIGAFRLPNDAFAKNAGTEVVTDVIFLQKLRANEKPEPNAAWLDTNGHITVDGQRMRVNRYYEENPGHILGRSALDGTMYAGGHGAEYTVHSDGRDLNKAIDVLISGDFADKAGILNTTASDADTQAAMLVQSDIPIGSMVLDENNRIIRRAMDDSKGNSVMEEVTPNSLWKDNAAEWGAILEALKDVRKAAKNGKGLEEAHAMLDSVAYITRTANGAKRSSPTLSEKSVYAVQDALESEGASFFWRFDQQMKEISSSYQRKQLGDENYRRLRGMLELRRKLQQLNAAERSNDPGMERIRKDLNGLYDSFVSKYGPVSDKKNFGLLGGDVGVETGLESSFQEGISPAQAKTKGTKPRKPSATKSDIFNRRVFYPAEKIERAGSSYDAMEISLSQTGRADVSYMAELTGKSIASVIDDLTTGEHPQLFMNPDTGEYEHAGEYLSGNVRRKLESARNAGLENNVRVLEAVQPKPKEKRNVTPNIRGTWIPAGVFEDFLSALGCERPKVSIVPGIGHIRAEKRICNATDFGMQFVNGNKSVVDIFNAAVSGKSMAVFDKDGHVIEEATQKVNALADRMGRVFSEWAYTDEERTKRIVDAYNDKMNTNNDRQYDGVKYLKTVGTSPSIVLRNTQKNAAWRMIQSPSVLLDHVVGAGKTFTVITGIMERRRLGLSKKPLVVVPNHLVTQWAQDFYRLYPGAKILAATPADFTAKNRKRLFARIATTKDVDAIIIGHSSLGYIPSPDFDLAHVITEQITILEAALDEARSNGESKRSLGQISQKLDSYRERLKDIAERQTDKIGHDMQTLGIDYIAVDEAHEFKNLEYATAGDRVVGMNDPNGSKKAFDLYVKLRGLRARGGGVTFATGTPLSNSLVELYTMMKYLAADDLKERNMLFFDSWAGSYAVTETRLEYTPTQKLTLRRVLAGLNNLSSLRQLYTSFADIITMQDLKGMYKAEMEERNKKNHTNLRTEFPVPKVATGGRRLDTAQATDTQRQMTDWLVARMDAIQENSGDKDYRRIDNYLTVMTDARKMSLDPRIINPHLPRDKNGKVMRSARNIKAIYDKWSELKGTQLVFCDMSTPSGAGQKNARRIIDEAAKLVFNGEQARRFKAMGKHRSFIRQWELVLDNRDRLLDSQTLNPLQRDRIEEYFGKVEDVDAIMATAETGFSVYDDLRNVLVEMGIPEREIAFIHDYESPEKKQTLFDRVNNGDVRVLVGSSAKMGAGMNVQKRLVGLHHLDSPWRSSDVEQREGRIVRQGNMFYEEDPDGFSVDIISYSTSGTADTVMWQILARKAAAIEQFRNGSEIDSMEESSSDADQYAEFMATSTGDPVFRRKMEAERRYQELDADVSGALMAQQNARDFLKNYERRVAENKNNLAVIENIETDESEVKKYAESIKKAEENYIASYVAFEKDSAAAKRALAEWENEPDKKKRGKKPESPVRPKRPSILAPEVQKAVNFARDAKKALEPLTESSASGTAKIPYGNGIVLVERINEHYTTPSWKVSFVPGKGNTGSYAVVIGQAEGKVPMNLSQMTETLLSPAYISNKIAFARENLKQILRRMETQKKNSDEIAARDIPLDKRAEAKTAMDWYVMQVAFAEVRADIARSERPNSFIENDRKHKVRTSKASLAPSESINVNGVEYRTTGVSAGNPIGAGTLLDAVRAEDNVSVILVKRPEGEHGERSVYDVIPQPRSVAAADEAEGAGHYRLGKKAQEKLDADSAAFAKQVDKYRAGKMGRYEEIRVMQTPLVLQISDERVKPLPVVMSQGTLAKIFKKHNLSPSMVKQLPKALADPIMVLRSDTHPTNSLVVMLAIKDSAGRTINVPITLNVSHGSTNSPLECNDISSMYGRGDIKTGAPHNIWFITQAKKQGQLLYIDKSKASKWAHDAGLDVPGRELIKKLNASVKTEADLVKAQSGKTADTALPPISVADVKARVKGAEVTDLGDGKMKVVFPNGITWIVDTQAEAIPVDPAVVRRDYGRAVEQGDVVKGRTRTIDGKTFIDMVASMTDAKTFSHEVFEASWDMLTKEEQGKLLSTYKSRENSAERYAEFLEKRLGKTTKATQRIFQRIKDFFASVRASLFGKNSEDVFREVAQGRMWSREAGTREDSEHYRLEWREKREKPAPIAGEPDTSVVVEKDAPWLRDLGTTQLERVVSPSRQDESIIDKLAHVKTNYYRQWFDRLNPIKKHFGEDIFFDAENAIYGAASRAQRRFEKGDPKNGVKGLLKIMEPIAANEQEGFATYSVYKHLNDIASNSENMIRTAAMLEASAKAKMREIAEDRKLASPDKEALVEWKKRVAIMKAEYDLYMEQARALREAVKFTRGSAAQYAAAVRKIEEHYPHWKKPQQELVRYNQALLEMLRDSGMISEEMHSRLLELYPNYVPLQRDFGNDENSVGGFIGGMGLVNIQSPLKRLKGSKRDVIDPLEQIVRNTFQFESAAARQSVGRNIMEEYDNGNFHEFMEEVEDRHHAPDEMVWHVWDKGKKRLFRSERDIYEALMPRARAKWEDNPVVAASRFITSLLRKGTTHGLTFALRNPVRDTFNYAIVGENFRPVIDTVRGLMMAFDKSVGSVYDEFMKSGGAQGMTVLTKNEHAERMKQLRHEKNTVLLSWASLKNPPKAVYELIGLISEYGELASRLGQFERAKAAGYTSDEAANLTRDNMNFMRMGTLGEQANQHIGFFNAALQGVDKMLRTYYKDGRVNKKALLRSFMYITVPSMLQMLYNFEDDDRRKRYENLPAWRKNTFWNFVIGKEGPIVSIPKPFEIGMIFGSIPERVMEYAYTKNKRVFEGMGTSLVSSLTPEFYPNALMLVAELGSNHSFFYQRQIVSEREKRFEPRLQYGPYTAEWAKAAGNALNISPRLLEYSVFSLGGGLAKETSNISDALVRKYLTKETRPERPWYEAAPGTRGFFAGDGSATESAFQSEIGILNRKKATAEEILRTKGAGALSDTERKILAAANDIKAVSRLNNGKGGIYDAYRAIREITTAKDIGAVDKRLRIRTIEESIRDASKRGLERIDEINAYLDR